MIHPWARSRYVIHVAVKNEPDQSRRIPFHSAKKKIDGIAVATSRFSDAADGKEDKLLV